MPGEAVHVHSGVKMVKGVDSSRDFRGGVVGAQHLWMCEVPLKQNF